jgi:hypothetical protein
MKADMTKGMFVIYLTEVDGIVTATGAVAGDAPNAFDLGSEIMSNLRALQYALDGKLNVKGFESSNAIH